MSPFATLDFPHGKVAFEGAVRSDDELADVFRVDLPERTSLYGEWRPKFAENGNDLDVEIVSFGFVDKLNVRNPFPKVRLRFTAEEQFVVQKLVRALFADELRRTGIVPFASKKARFLGGVHFLPGWIVRRSWLPHWLSGT